MPIEILRLARTSNISAHTHFPGSSASEYTILRQKKLIVNRIPEEIPKNPLFFHFPAFWTFFGLFFSSATVVADFSPEGGQPKKPGLARTVSGFVAGGIQKATVAFRVIIWENQHRPVIGKTEY